MEENYKNLKKLIHSYPYSDLDPFYNYINKFFKKLKYFYKISNYHKLNEKEVLIISKMLKLVNNSNLLNIFHD